MSALQQILCQNFKVIILDYLGLNYLILDYLTLNNLDLNIIFAKSLVMKTNPFIITEDYLAPEDFCDREFERSVLQSNIINGRNTVLISPRRMGKSGLIAHVIREKSIAEAYTTFTLDLFPTSCLAEMLLLLSNEIVGKMKSREERFLDHFVAVIKSLRPGVKMNPVSGELEFNLSLGEILRPQESLEEIFRYLDENPKPCIVAIDEFQQIAKYHEKNVTALLRSH